MSLSEQKMNYVSQQMSLVGAHLDTAMKIAKDVRKTYENMPVEIGEYRSSALAALDVFLSDLSKCTNTLRGACDKGDL